LPARTLAQRRPNAAAFAGVFSATLLCFLAVGAVLPVLPRYVVGPLGGGDVEAGIVTGAFAFAAIVGRPIGGRIADRRGRRLVVVAGLVLSAIAGGLYFLPFGVAGLVFARLVLGWGDGWVFTAGLAWTVDLAPAHVRGRAIAWYGLGVWGGLSIGPIIGEVLLAVGGYDAVWAFAAASPLAGALLARIVPDRRGAGAPAMPGRQPLLPRAALRPGLALFLANVGYATLAGFVVLHLEEQGSGGGAAVFTACAVTVVGARLLLAWLPDRVGPRTTAVGSGIAQAIGLALIAVASDLPVAIAGAVVMGTGFSLSFPSLALLVVDGVDERQRGAAMGGFSSFFDLGVGIGAPAAGVISATAGYATAFWVAAAFALAGAAVIVVSPSGPRKLGPSVDVT
jgi:MFS family permease